MAVFVIAEVDGAVTVTEITNALPAGTNTLGKIDQGVGGASAWKVDGSAVTQPVSGTISISGSVAVTGPLTDAQLRASSVPISASALPLPTGAATAVKQPALGVAGTASTDVITVQGIGAGTALNVTGPLTDAQLRASSVPISASALPLPTGASTETTLSSINTKTLAAGQAVMASSSPVVIASNQSSIPVTDNAESLTVDSPQLPAALTGSGSLKVAVVESLPAGTNQVGRVEAVGAAANGAVPVGNPQLVAGWDGTLLRSLLTDTAGQLKVVSQAQAAVRALTLAYVESVAVAGAQADYFYSGLNYTVPASYSFVCAQFNSRSDDARVTARVSKFIVVGTFNVGTSAFTGGSSYGSPEFSSYLEAEVTTVIGGVNDLTLTATYTNQDGTASRTATALLKKNTPVGFKVIFTLQAGDYGVRSVQNVTRSTANTGIVSIKAGVEFYSQGMTTALLNYITTPGIQAMRATAGEIIELAWSSNAAATALRTIKVAGFLEAA